MNKRIFILIVVLMSISLIGIISVQVYWINDSINNKQQRFETNVRIALAQTAERIKEREEQDILREYTPFIESNLYRTKTGVANFLYQQIDTTGRKKFLFSEYIEEEHEIPTQNFGNPNFDESIVIKKITGKRDFMSIVALTGADNNYANNRLINKFTSTSNFNDWNTAQLYDAFSEVRKRLPLKKRISNSELNATLKEEFTKRNVKQEFKYGVYEDGLATSLKSGYFKIQPEDNFYYPLFEDEKGNSIYKLYVKFPNKEKEILSDIVKILILSLLFIGIIIAAFSTSLYQLVRQKKISEIKTDFINNMTHEFKTPIATINLALDAIKNPKIIKDEDKVKRYVQMIRDENKRMHGQVENVLRISKLEKNQIDISKDAVDMHDIIEEAIEHIQLIVDDKKGSVTKHFKAISTEVLGNQFHLTNVIVNMLENAIKYSEKPPKIDVFSENTNKFFIFKIKDEGIGMSKNAQKYVFDKFYREHKGNIHNVKGHGLGLAYVKEIITNHQGSVFVDSEKGKGSTFTIKIPLI
ncbi:HAMP domain-containing sensor histidine kinase [uncultured Tenacibaculum sp.]|uniref:sensor histidine kinase n=1 Tax=uncultured Tenacibaculum sp. TaxID=174713 RepID=UPI00260DCB13|nr:HAMP domain-containing sensor histidine kinase [uncultured Tenacibaculum sp.]